MKLDPTVLELGYKQKSEISHSLVGKRPTKNRGTRDASVGRSNEAAAYYLPQKRAPFFTFFNKTHAITQQVLSVQTGLYRYKEWMVQDINNKNRNGS